MIEIRRNQPAPAKQRERIIDLVAMKQYGDWLCTQGREAEYEAYHFGNLTFDQRHDIACAWAGQRDHDFDAGRGDYYR